jgi:hypothetical protein
MPGLLQARPTPVEIDQHDYVAIHQLPRRPHLWPSRSLIIAGASLVAAGGLTVFNHSGYAILTLIAGTLLIAAVITFAVRNRKRGQRLDPMIEAVNALNASSLSTRDLVRASHWKDGWIGYPEHIKIHYNPTLLDGDPQLISKLLVQVNSRLGVPYALTENDSKRCIFHITRDRRTPEPEPSESVARASQVVQELLGATTSMSFGVDEDGEVVAIDVKHNIGNRVAAPSFRHRVEVALSSRLPGRWRARWTQEDDTVRFEIRPTLPEMILPPIDDVDDPDPRTTYPGLSVPFGMDEDGEVMTWTPEEQAHCLVTGGTGSGKTRLILGVVDQLARQGWKIDIADAKLTGLIGLGRHNWPNVRVIATRTEDIVRLIHYAHELMEERYAAIVSGRAEVDDFEPYLIVLDEFADFRETLMDIYPDLKAKGDPARPSALRKFPSVMRKAREARVHILLGLQRPDAEFLTGEARDNFGCRISMGRLSVQGALMMWEDSSTGVGLPRKSRGLGVTLNHDSRPAEFRAFYIPDPRKVRPSDTDDIALLDALRPTTTRHERMMIVPPKAEPDIDDVNNGEPLPPTYTDWATARIVPYDAERAAEYVTCAGIFHDGNGERHSPAEVPTTGDPGDSDETEATTDGYEEPSNVRASDVEPGDLILLDEAIAQWGVVEEVTPDLIDESNVTIDVRDDQTGDPESVSVAEDEYVTVRRPMAAV